MLKTEYKRIVVKIGSSLIYTKNSKIDYAFFKALSEQVYALIKAKKEIILVSSGAIALGMSILRMASRPKDLSTLQATAAIGQHALMQLYQRFFKDKGLNCAQLLLTWEDFDNRKRYLNAKNTLLTLFKLGAIPIINENDTVSTEEIKFGDNDRLCALVANLISADLLIILSDVDGLLDKDKKIIRQVNQITPFIKSLCRSTNKKTCIGGMVTKIEAANITTDAGIPCLIANGRYKDIIILATKEPESVLGTLFLPKKTPLTGFKRWLAFGAKPKGKIIVDEGAKNALLNKKSLLSVGIVACEGNFEAGDVVSVFDKQSQEFARGKISVSSKNLEKVKGRRFDKEIIHCDNLVIL